ncbi:hypothetical protein G5714_004215 [Onychostoma macrolepis]|uniref:Uncharacterized protein n=1 Tax=Onychostoma macrolepis TaxID=369639 RepID=A0A7J6D492_9TELE|nr:hypothetical protein G5714_004215 [Onychostoma macrolepis]
MKLKHLEMKSFFQDAGTLILFIRRDQKQSPAVCLKSDWSMDRPIRFCSSDSRTGLSSVHQKQSPAVCL